MTPPVFREAIRMALNTRRSMLELARTCPPRYRAHWLNEADATADRIRRYIRQIRQLERNPVFPLVRSD